MNNTNVPSDMELPSTGKLIKSTMLAAIVAAFILIIAVLPAEYGIDPTGIGGIIGLKKMGEIKAALAKEGAVATALESGQQSADGGGAISSGGSRVGNVLTHEMKVTLDPFEGTEIKLKMEQGKRAKYVWWTDGGPATFDFHADSKEPFIEYHRYKLGYEQKSEGVLEAAFDGNHGWHWSNRTPAPFTITLQTSGEYTNIKEIR